MGTISFDIYARSCKNVPTNRNIYMERTNPHSRGASEGSSATISMSQQSLDGPD